MWWINPFGNDEAYDMELLQVVAQTMESDIPLYMNANVSVGRKLKQLLMVVAESVPFKPVMQKLADVTGISRNYIQEYGSGTCPSDPHSPSSKYVLYNVPHGSGSLTHEEVSLSLVALPRLLPGPLWRRSVLAGCQGSVCSRLHPRMSAVC